MALTVREKEHWKDRIEVRIKKKIERIQQDHKTSISEIDRQALQRAEESLEIVELQADLKQIEEQLSKLGKRKRRIQEGLLAKVRCVPAEELRGTSTYCCNNDVKAEVEKRQKRFTDELLAETEVGREILKLKEQKENLLDVVWLATSPSQIKTLWSDVLSLLEDTPSQLEQQALNIEPLSDN